MKTKDAARRQTQANRQRILREMRQAIIRSKLLNDLGFPQERIARALNEEGFTTRTGLAFTQGTVCHLLREFATEV